MSDPYVAFTNRRELRQDIARRLGDFVELTATADGTDVVFRSSVDLAVTTDAYRGRQFIITGGDEANVGQIRRVVQNSPAEGGRLSVTPPTPAPMLAGTTAELYDEQSISYRIEQIHAAINRAIRFAAYDAPMPDRVLATATATGGVLSVPLPDDWLYLYRVRLGGTDAVSDDWFDVRIAQRHGESGWWVEAADLTSATVTITNGPAWSWSALGDCIRDQSAQISVLLDGLRRPPPLTDEDSGTSIDSEWIIEHCLAELQEANAHRRSDRQAEERMGMIREQNAERMRQQGRTRRLLPKNARRIR